MSAYNFDDIAEIYDAYYETSLGKQVDHVEKQLIWKYMIRMSLEHPLLEIGCGTGHWTLFFRQKGLKLTAIDLSGKMMDKAIKKNPKKVHFEKMNVEDMKFKDHAFENINTITTLEFVENLEQAFKEIDRVLRPGGSLVVGCLNELSESGQQKKENEIYRNAHFFQPEELKTHLSILGEADIAGCAIIEKNQVLDYPDIEQIDPFTRLTRGAFLAGYVKKLKS